MKGRPLQSISSALPGGAAVWFTAGLVFLVFLTLPPPEAQSGVKNGSAYPGFDPDPRALEYGGKNTGGNYSWQDLTEAALWASGADPQGTFRETIFAAVTELKADPDLPPEPRERGGYILNYMHRRYLKMYSAHQTRLDDIFISGRYNCVSSAVLYTILAVSAELDVRGVVTRDHAFVTINTGTELIDVETTNSYGFDPGNRQEFIDRFGTVTGFAYVPARNYRDRISISRLELVSLILINRIAELEMRNRHTEALPLLANRALFLSNRQNPVISPFFPDPQKEFLDRLFNYGASLLNGNRDADAIAWAEAGQTRYPDDPRWSEFIFTALNNQVVKLVQAKRIQEAREFLSRNSYRLNQENRTRLANLVFDAELTEQINGIRTSRETEEALRLIDHADPAQLPPDRREEMRSFVLLNESKRRASAGGAAEAVAYLEAAITRYGGSNRLEEALRVYRQNRLAELHNRFAEFYNRRDFEAARQASKAGLDEFPGNRQLQSDLRQAEQALQRAQ